MKGLTAEWLSKAEEDYSVATGLIRRRKTPADSICFHCQQAGEKYLKSLLQEQGIHFGKTHDLEGLLRSCLPQFPQLAGLSGDAKLLNDYAVQYRYPGMDATKSQARRAIQSVSRLRKALLKLLVSP
jgi:HEPN domain-containing protein